MPSKADATLPDAPYPAHDRAIDIMLGATLQRLDAVATQHHRLNASNNPYGRGGKLTPEQRRQIIEIGYTRSAPDIAGEFGVHPRTIQNIRRASKLKPPKERGVPKKTRQKIAALGYRMSADAIAERFKISARTVHKIRAEFDLEPPNTRKRPR